jgi:hypothetical protein
MALRASGLDYKALAAYLIDGITWSRFRAIATQAPGEGGLSLFRDGSQACKAIFSVSPSSIVQTRPDTDLKFLEFLKGKERTLHRLASRDLEQRTSLGAEFSMAVLNLGDISLRILRLVLCEILHRCMFLMHWSSKHPKVAAECSWDELVAKAVEILVDLSLTPKALERFQTTPEALEGMVDPPKTWVELAVLEVVGEEDLVAEHLKPALDFHRKVTDQAAAHLALLADNTFRTPWLAAKLLSKNKALAQAAAKDLARHLATTRPGNKTLFEQHLFESPALWQNLVAFSESDPPVLLWHGHGKFEALFRFLAPRFLLAPDHVLDAERIHARWQWACTLKRSVKLMSLNACLRLTHYLENNQSFPGSEELLPHLQAEGLDHHQNLEAIAAEGEVALGWRREFLYRERLGLSAADYQLLAQGPLALAAPAGPHVPPFALAWRNYIKQVLKRGYMYRLSINPAVVVYVSENKTLAGREDRAYEGEATGRKLVVSFFEDLEGGLVRRVDRTGTSLKLQLLTIAEILQACGELLPPDPERSTAAAELLLEKRYQDLEVRRWDMHLETTAPEVHTYSLHEEVLAEAALAVELLAEHRTKMVLARCLQRHEALAEGETLQELWGIPLAALQARAAPLLPAPAPAPPLLAPARGRGGKGRGRGGRGRGRGRGPG